MPDFQSLISLNECVGETLDLLKHSVSGNIVVESFAEQSKTELTAMQIWCGGC